MNIKSLVPTALLIVLVAAAAYSLGENGLPKQLAFASGEVKNQSSTTADSQDVKQRILAKIRGIDETVDDIELDETPVDGVYWVLLPNNETLLISEDARYLLGRNLSEFKGDGIEPVTSEVVDAAIAKSKEALVGAFENTADTQVVFPAQGDKQGEVYVFTDVNCGYCRKFHADVPALNAAGIEVRYFAGPFFSRDRLSLERIWCAENSLEAMDIAKAGQKLDKDIEVTDACKQTVSAHMELGQKLGIRGTPALFTRDGEQLGGYVPPQQLIARLSGN